MASRSSTSATTSPPRHRARRHQEDVNVVGLSSYNGGHIVFFKEVADQLKKSGNGDIPVFGGGGGTITQADARVMKRQGTDRIISPARPSIR